MISDRELVKMAIDAKNKSYSPYSGFRVGAALLTSNGATYTGCNIESASYSPTNCAERTAFFKAVSEGERDFNTIAIAGSLLEETADYCYPCGVCRQVMAEFCAVKDFRILIAKSDDEWLEYSLEQLLPFSFGPKDLNK